ncbi:MAG: hypothetical protein IEMM0008_0630 [bacterium]|nr:MAG: hypothetical protein IEMM0008_0630 [bacterium]
MTDESDNRQVVKFGNIRIEQGRGYQKITTDNTSNSTIQLDKSLDDMLGTLFNIAVYLPVSLLLTSISLIILLLTGSWLAILPIFPLLAYTSGLLIYRNYKKKKNSLDVDQQIALILQEKNGIITPLDLTIKTGMPLEQSKEKLSNLSRKGLLGLDSDDYGNLLYKCN